MNKKDRKDQSQKVQRRDKRKNWDLESDWKQNLAALEAKILKAAVAGKWQMTLSGFRFKNR